MSARMTDALLPLSAAFWLFAAVHGAAAFSQIGTENGESEQKEGIVSVPLPPIEAPAGSTASPSTPDAGSAPAHAAPTGATSPAPGGTAPAVTPPANAGTHSDKPASASPDPTIGEGETAKPAIDPAAAPAAAAPATAPATPEAAVTPDATGDEDTSGDESMPASAVPPAEIFYGDADLPKPVRDLRAKLIEICKAGEIEALRPYIEVGEDGTTVTFGGTEGDPIEFLKSASGDGQGVETLAILLEVLQAGHVHNEAGTDDEIFVWPYFTGVPLDKLTKPQQVQLFELVTAGDYQEMLGFGAYNFYRAGISPDGKLQFFVAGD